MQIQWQACFGGSEADWIDDIIETDEGGYFILGTTYSGNGDVTSNHGDCDIWLVKTDSIGNMQWQRCYGGSGPEMATNIIKDSLGYYYFGGWTGSNDGDVQSGNHGDFDRWVVKITPEGEIIWEECYGGSGQDYGGTLLLLSDGNILVYSATHSGDGDVPINYGFLDIWLMKITPQGEIIESHVYGNQLHNNVLSVIETGDSGYFFAGKAECLGGMVQGDYKGDIDVWAVKLNSQFEIEWQQLYGGSYIDFGISGVLELDDGYLFLAGTTSNDKDVSGYHGSLGDISGVDIWAVHINSMGNIQWQRCLGGGGFEATGTLHKAIDGGFIIVGETQSNNGDVSGNHSWAGYSDIWMVKLSNEGELVWQQCYGGLNDERIYHGAIKISEDNWILAGRMSYNTGDVICDWHGLNDYWVFEIKDTTTNTVNYTLKESEINVYPNPAKDYIEFEIRSLKFDVVSDIRILNVMGKEMARLRLETERTVWDCREVPEGIYFYSFKIDERWLNGKIIILR